MQRNNIEYRVLKMSLIIALAGLIVFLALIPINYSLSIGWIAGASVVMLGYLIGVLLIKKFFKKGKSKSLGFWIGWLRFKLSFIFHGGIFISIIAINNVSNGHSFAKGGISDMISPINIFTYIGGVSIIFLSTLVIQFLSRKEGENDTT